MHEHNLAHLDIKPENIFIGDDGHLKLGDFGLVINLDSVRKSLQKLEFKRNIFLRLLLNILEGGHGGPV